MAVIPASLNLDFARTRQLDPRITFTNASDNRSYFDANGVMKFAAANEPRFDHNPVTGESLGLLIEEQRTNLLTYSEQFDNAAWDKNNTTITANAETAPDGTVTMDKLIATSSGGSAVRSARQNAMAVTSGLVYCYSVYAKAGEESVVTIRFETTNSAFTFAFATFDLSSGTVSSNTAESAGIENIGNGIYRVWATKTATATENGRIQIQLRNFTYVGDDVSGLYIWGAQLEVGALPTSYIKTEGSQVTRAADSAEMTGTNFSSWYNQIEGTLFTLANCMETYAGVDRFPPIFEISDGTNNEAIRVFERRLTGNDNDLLFVVRDNNVAQASIQVNSANTVVGQYYKIAGAYKLNNLGGASDGNTAISVLSGTIPTVNQARIGSGLTGHLNGHVKRIVYYPRRLSNAQLRAITS